MNDFYSVLKQSIMDRGLKSPAQREEVYAQARAAMIRQLWSFDPPLAEDEIDARIGTFDRTVERIEKDLAAAFAETRRAAPLTRPAPVRQASAVEGYDDEADYAPSGGGRPARSPAPPPSQRRQPEPTRTEPAWARRPDPLAERSAAVEEALRGDYGSEEEAPETYGSPFAPDEADELPHAENDYGGWHQDEADRAEEDPADEAGDEYDAAPEGRPREIGRRKPEAKPRGARAPSPQDWWNGLSETTKVRTLIGTIAALALVLIIAGVTVVASILSDNPAPQVATPLPVGGAVSGPAAPATTVASESADVVQSFTLFDGSDPTVFESTPDNPVRFDKDAGGTSFARISSSTGSPGVRLNIGPGIANRLAGEPVRVVIVARSAKEGGAANMRFAYQSGVALSHWQTADLRASDMAYGIAWRVPKIQTDPNGDYLLIEPGIPGDGTAADIRSVRLDLLAKEPG